MNNEELQRQFLQGRRPEQHEYSVNVASIALVLLVLTLIVMCLF